ncbi:pilus-assembly fibrillin subunit [Raoultella sp. R2A007]|uniref:pilus-assembly fibrillin subunit n=1 Tax=Raoultella sp. R2A007 TaxID=3416669 RepID=UPI003CF90B08
MKITTTTLMLTALLSSAAMNSLTLHADALSTWQQVFIPDLEPSRGEQEWARHEGRLDIHGELLSSPCQLKTNEIHLPLPVVTLRGERRTLLNLELTGCGYGDPLISVATPAEQSSVMMVHSTLLTGQSGGFLPPGQKTSALSRLVLHGGSTRLTWSLNDAQRQMLTPSAKSALRLQLNYE